MSLRSRLFVLLGLVLIALGAAQWWLVRSLTSDLGGELVSVASKVGNEVAGVAFQFQREAGSDGGPPEELKKIIEGSALPADLKERFLRGAPPPPGVHEEIQVTVHGAASGATPPRIVVKNLRVETTDAASAPNAKGKPGDRMLFVAGPKTGAWIPIDQEGIRRAVGRFQTTLLGGSVFILGLGFLASALVADRIASPVRALARAARRVESGEVGHQIEVRASGEAAEAVEAFNRMSARLADLEKQALAMKEREHLSELGDVARGLAHALRNPLHALGLSVDQLAAKAGKELESEELRMTALRQIRNLDGVIRSFLAFASSGGNQEESVDAVALAQDVVLSALQDVRGRVSLEVEASAEPLQITAVSAELRAALQALVVNAIDASPDGSTIEVSVAPAGSRRIAWEVRDRGAGLSAEVRARLFTPHLTTKSHGSGMGLFLTHRLAVTRYSGALTLSDRAGGGTIARLETADRTGGTNG